MEPLPAASLPAGIRSRILPDINGLDIHVLEAGKPTDPAVLLLHGYPELAWSWRKVMPVLAAAGYHAIAPDHRGYGRTSVSGGGGTPIDYDADLSGFRFLNLLRDEIGVLYALGHRTAEAVVGHDFGAAVASFLALVRPDIFKRMVLMSAPFGGIGTVPFDTAGKPPAPKAPDIHAALAALPRPRKHYQWYQSTRPANENQWHAKQGLHAFLRAYYHHKSADWKGNKPYELKGWTAEELAKMPTYYIMDLAEGMAETVAKEMPSAAEIAANRWLTEADLKVYSDEFSRTGFQGGMNWYRVRTSGLIGREYEAFAGRTIDQPSAFISGKSDWGNFQTPGALERMQKVACTNMKDVHFVEGAGHWVQQEKADEVTRLLLGFLGKAISPAA